MAADYEKLGLFYVGKRYDVASSTRLADLILYDSRDLLTHAVVLGMTGSGKTGLGITLLEEAAIDGVPVLAIDPKGDLANLLLTLRTGTPFSSATKKPAARLLNNGARHRYGGQRHENSCGYGCIIFNNCRTCVGWARRR